MHHVAGTVDNDLAAIANCVVARLFVGSPGLMTLFAIDNEHWAFDMAEKFHSLGGVKGLG